jgi:serine protease Do
MQLDVIRGDKRIDAQVDLVAAPKTRLDAETYRSEVFELTVRELVFQDYRNFDLKPEFKGVLVTKVEEGGWAGVGGLETGDIIQKVDDRAIGAPGDVKDALEGATHDKRKKLVFFVQRGGRTQIITVQPSWSGSS